MQQRQRVGEALAGAARNVKSNVVRRLGEQIVQVQTRQAGRHVRLFAIVEQAQALLQPEGAHSL